MHRHNVAPESSGARVMCAEDVGASVVACVVKRGACEVLLVKGSLKMRMPVSPKKRCSSRMATTWTKMPKAPATVKTSPCKHSVIERTV